MLHFTFEMQFINMLWHKTGKTSSGYVPASKFRVESSRSVKSKAILIPSQPEFLK